MIKMWKEWNLIRRIMWPLYLVRLISCYFEFRMTGAGLPPGYPQIHAVGIAIIGFLLTGFIIFIVDVVQAMTSAAKKDVEQAIDNRKRIYNDLPEIGKISEDIKVKKAFAFGGFAAPIAVWAFFGVLMTPMIALLPASVAARWAWNNCKEQSSEILKDQERRKTLCS